MAHFQKKSAGLSKAPNKILEGGVTERTPQTMELFSWRLCEDTKRGVSAAAETKNWNAHLVRQIERLNKCIPRHPNASWQASLKPLQKTEVVTNTKAIN